MAIPGYRILRKIRQGGMSTVYLAVQKSVDREVAIKVMSPTLNNDPSFGSRFYREAKIVGKLSHPNIVSIYDVGSHKHYNYIAMDYLPGMPLQDKLTKGITPQESVTIMREMASALDYAHQQGFIHRDIKPDNILFRADGSSVLCDFGIAKSVKTDMNMTSVGSVLGTPHYMSPEQAQGKTLDHRADLYSLGVVFFEMLTGQPPFTSDDPIAVAVKHMSSPIPKLPTTLKVFQPLINKLMAKKASARFQNGKEIIDALDSLQPKLNRGSYTNFTQQHSTAVHVYGLIQALLSTLGTAISQSLKRLLINKKQFRQSTIQLNQEQLEQIDDFILNNNETNIRTRLVSKPIGKARRGWLYWPASLAITLLGGFIYLNDYHPETLTHYFEQYNEFERSIAAVDINKINISDIIPKQQPATSQTKPSIIKKPEQLQEQAIVRDAPAKQYLTAKKYPLTIKTEPSTAKVTILNIKPSYKHGIRLEQGSYHIKVSATDYFSDSFWVKISNQGMTESVNLKPTRKLLAAGTILNDKLSDGSQAPPVVVLPKGSLTVHNSKPYTLTNDKPIAVGQTEVTFADYDKFLTATGQSVNEDYEWGRGRRPVININLQDAVDYTQWLTDETGQHYRLPTGNEWEFANRSNSPKAYWWGDKGLAGKANCRRGCDSEWSKLFSSSTAPVASYPANPFGLYDTSGNVEEWLADCVNFDEQRRQCKTGLTAGGSHDSSLKYLQSHKRRQIDADKRTKTIGFRVVLEL